MECLEAKIDGMSEWSEQLVSRFSAQLRARRTDLNLSAQDVADRTEQLGHPVSRTAIADYEIGRRKDRLMLGDALAIAAALRMPLAALMYPHMPDGDVEVLPGRSTSSLAAAQALIGEPSARVHTEFASDDNRQHEYQSGESLYALSIQIVQMRDRIKYAQSRLDDAEARAEIDASMKWSDIIDEYRAVNASNAEILRTMGGVVNDG